MADWEDAPSSSAGWEDAPSQSQPLKKAIPPPSTSKGIKPRVANPSGSAGLSLMDSAAAVGEDIKGVAAAGTNLLTYLPRALVGTAYGAGKAALAGDLGKYAPNFNKVMEASAIPVTGLGNDLDELLALPGRGAHWLGEQTYEATKGTGYGPALGTAAEVIPLGILMSLGLKGGKAAVKPKEPLTVRPSPMPADQWATGRPTIEVIGGQARLTAWEDAPAAAPVAPVANIAPVAGVAAVVAPKEQASQITAPMAAADVAPKVGAVAAPRAEPINLKQFSDPSAKILEDTIGSFTPEQIAYAKRGKISFDQAQILADATGHNVEYFVGNRPGSVYNAETLQRFGNLVDNSTKEIAALAEKAIDPFATSADLLAFKESQLLHSALVNRFIGASSEAGRTLNQLKANKGTMDNAKYLEKAMEQFGGTDKILEMARVTAQAAKDGTLRKTLAKGSEFKWSDAFLEAWKAGLLSGIKTQIKNVTSNLYANLMSIPERATSAAIGTMRSAVTGSNDKVSFREVGAMVDAWRDLPNAMSNFGKALSNEDYLMTGGGKGDIFNKAITAENFRSKGIKIPAGSTKEKFVDNAGKVIRTPFRTLNATDIGFKSIAAHQQLRALAARDAAKANLRGEAFDSFMAERLANPTKAQMEAAMDWAHYLTYTKELGKFGKAFQGLTHSHPALQVITPFTSTPINLAKFFVERTPLQFLSRTTRDTIKAGGAEADMALGKIAVGTGIMWALGEAVQNNVISMPYSLDPGAANLEYQAGYRPFAYKTDTGYVPIDNIDPLGSMVAMSAGIVALQNFYRNDMKNLPKLEQINKLAAHVVDTMNNVFIDKTYAQGAANAIESAKSEHGMQQFVNGLAKSTTPTLVRDIVAVNDPAAYVPLSDSESMIGNVTDKTWQATKATLPFVDKTELNMGLDMWGEPRVKSTVSVWNPWKESPVTQEAATLQRIKYGIGIPSPINETKMFGTDLNESDQKYWKQLQGRYAKTLMINALQTPIFQGEATPAIDLARQKELQMANQTASQLATGMLEVQKGFKEKDQMMEELTKKLFPKPKRQDITK